MADAERLYSRLPVIAQNLAVTFEGYRVRRKRMDNREFRVLLRSAEERGTWLSRDIAEFRDDRLRTMLGHAYDNVPFYRDWFARAGVHPNDVRGVQDLHHLPILTKSEVQGSGPFFRDRSARRTTYTMTHTSGTTGGGLQFAVSESALREQWAIWWRHRRRHGIQLNTRCGYFGGRSISSLDRTQPPYWRHDVYGRRVLFSAYHLSARTAADYANEIRRRKLTWLHGYPSVLSLLGHYLEESGEQLGDVVRHVTCGAESLLPDQRRIIAKAFGASPTEHYGLAEGAANASACSCGNLHFDEDYAAVEFIEDAASGGLRIVGTNLSNAVTPFIRYDTGDLVSELTSCECGLPGAVVAAIDGRQEDYVRVPNGALVGRLDHIFKDLTTVREAQIHQWSDGHVEILISPTPKADDTIESTVVREARTRLGQDISLSVRRVDAIPRCASGKLRFVVSDLEPRQLQL